jgi:hypothetical protein
MKLLLFVYAASVVLTLSGCQPGGSQEAIVSGNNTCVTDPTTCTNSAAYQNNQGYTPYNYGTNNTNNNSGYYNSPFNYYNNNAYLCNCPAGSLPTYNSGAGLGCVRTTHLTAKASSLSAFFYLSWGQNNQWNNLNQIYRYNYGGNQGYQSGYGNSSCYNGAVQSCNVNQSSNCPAGYLCRANSSSTMGLCVLSNR